MISLVTQSDGSARRFPFVSLALALAMGFTFWSVRDQTASVQAEADAAIQEAVVYFEKHPYLVIPDRMTRYIPAERVATLREADAEAREEARLHTMHKTVEARVQSRFDGMVSAALAKLGELPANAFAVSGEPVRNFDHVLHHASSEALVLSLFALLLFGMALEDAWGSVVFGAFSAAMIPAAALLYTTFPPALAQPWLGGAGLSVAVLGASMARWMKSGSPRLLGGIPLAPWLWIPAWFAADALWARGLARESLDLAPVFAYGALLVAGFGVALLIRNRGFEERLTDRWDDSNSPVKNPAYEEAMDLREDGKHEAAMQMLVESFGRKPSVDLALGMWDVSKELGRPETGAVGALHLVRDALRRKDGEEAASYWRELVENLEVVDAEPSLFVKMAGALLAAGEDSDATTAIEYSVRAPRPLPPGLALEAANWAAERDSDVASRVAVRAIATGSCSAREKAALQEFVATELDEEVRDSPSEEMLAESRIPGGEPLVVRRRELKGFKGLRAKSGESLPQVEPAEVVSDPGVESDEVYDNLDPGAFDPSALGADEDEGPVAAQSIARMGEAEEGRDSFSARECPAQDISNGDEEATASVLIGLRTLRAIEAVPLALEPTAIKIDVEEKGKARLPFERIEAIAVAAVGGLRDRPVVLVDLVLNLRGDPSESLRVLRVRSDRFDPRGLVEGASTGVEALRLFIEAIVAGSRSDMLPNERAVLGEPFATFESLLDYHREVLNAEAVAN